MVRRHPLLGAPAGGAARTDIVLMNDWNDVDNEITKLVNRMLSSSGDFNDMLSEPGRILDPLELPMSTLELSVT